LINYDKVFTIIKRKKNSLIIALSLMMALNERCPNA
jgi:hypothetical protein